MSSINIGGKKEKYVVGVEMESKQARKKKARIMISQLLRGKHNTIEEKENYKRHMIA